MADTLFAQVDNPSGIRRIVLVHGFTQTRDCWGPLPDRLASAGYEVMRVDLPGHGRSAHADADLWSTADLLATTGGPATYLGYSLGARVCLHLALRHPALLDRLVLEGGTAGIADPEQRAARQRDDEALARHVEEVGTDDFLHQWLGQPLFAALSPANSCLEARRENAASGLAASLRACGTGRQDPLWERLAEIEAPTLCVVGQEDTKFAAVNRAMVEGIGSNASLAVVPAAGHTAHLEDPDGFWEAVKPFLVRWARLLTR